MSITFNNFTWAVSSLSRFRIVGFCFFSAVPVNVFLSSEVTVGSTIEMCCTGGVFCSNSTPGTGLPLCFICDYEIPSNV